VAPFKYFIFVSKHLLSYSIHSPSESDFIFPYFSRYSIHIFNLDFCMCFANDRVSISNLRKSPSHVYVVVFVQY
jgi:hypothetical protein